MTGAVISPPARQSPATTIGFSNLLLSEWTKLRSVRSTYWTTIVAAFLTARGSCLHPLGAAHHR